MITINEAINRLKLHEGLRLSIYKCTAGYPTIGIGRNLVTNPLTAEERRVCENYQQGITANQAYYLCKNDIYKFDNQLKSKLEVYQYLDDERQYALLDLCFNMGIAKLLQFPKMLSNLEIGNYRGAAKELLNSRYAKQVGKRTVRIATLIETGKWVI